MGKETTGSKPASTPTKKTEKVNSENESVTPPKKKNGGARPGAGRKPNAEKLKIKGIKEMMEAHAQEVVDVVVTNKQTQKTEIVKKTRQQALLDVLYTEGHNSRNISAIKEYFDRTQGKATQYVEMETEVKVEEQRPPTKAELAAARAYEELMDEDEEDFEDDVMEDED